MPWAAAHEKATDPETGWENVEAVAQTWQGRHRGGRDAVDQQVCGIDARDGPVEGDVAEVRDETVSPARGSVDATVGAGVNATAPVLKTAEISAGVSARSAMAASSIRPVKV